ncbi:MAG: AMP-binding protein [Myxococcota bacterium]
MTHPDDPPERQEQIVSTKAFDRLVGPSRARPQAPAIVAGSQTITANTLLERSTAWAARLRAHGLSRGARVAVLTPPHPEAVAIMLGSYRAGLVHVPINPRYRGAELHHIVQDCGAALLLCDPQLADDRLDALPDELDCRGITPGSPLLPLPPASTIETTLTEPPLHDDETALLIYTSGTTGRSKGVRLSLAGIVGNIGALTTLWQWSDRDILSLSLPLFHVHGLCIGIHGALLHGMAVRLHARFDPAAIIDDFRADATVFMGVPTMYDRLLEHLDAHPDEGPTLARGRLFTAGSAALRPALLERWEAHTGHRILERYGMSETLITLSNPHDEERRPGAVGHPVPGCEIRVVDETGADVPAGVMGELWVRGPHLMQGYWGRPEDTAAAYTKGWFRTGDMVRSDPDGYLRIIGRRSTDIIKSGGFKIAAPEIEQVLREHPDVREAAVVGIPDHRWGERIAAAVVPNAGAEPEPQDLTTWVAEHLAEYKKPRQIALVQRLPRNALGKVQKPRIVASLRRPEDPER